MSSSLADPFSVTSSSTPLHATRSQNLPFEGTRKFCVIVMANPDKVCQTFIQKCADVCAYNVHNHCLQDPDTLHFTVCVDSLSFGDAEALEYMPGPLPLFHITGLIDWKHVVALKSDTDMTDVVERLGGLNTNIDVNDLNNNLHMTIYKLRGKSGPPYHWKQKQFQRIKDMAENIDSFGTARGTKVVLKEIGGCYSGSDGRFYRILYEE